MLTGKISQKRRQQTIRSKAELSESYQQKLSLLFDVCILISKFISIEEDQELNFSFEENGNVTDPQYNAVLRATLEECRRNNVPKETIERAIKRAVKFSFFEKISE